MHSRNGAREERRFVADLVRALQSLAPYAGRLGTQVEADDLIQETAYRAWRRRETYDPERGTLRAWLYGILRRAWLDGLRCSHRELSLTCRPAAAPAGPDTAALCREVLVILLSLPNAELISRQASGETCRQLAEAAGVSLGTVLSRISRARAALQAELGS